MADRHILITGASSGIGRALALHYAGRGVMLSLTGRNTDRLAAVATDCIAKGAKVDHATLDITDAAAVAAWIAARWAAAPVDLAIAAAGLGGAAALAPPDGEGAAAASALVATNTLGVIHTIAPLGQAMAARGAGQLVILGSIQGAIGLPQSPAYSASKAAVKIYGDGLRRLLRPRGVGLCIVLPGFVDTPMSRSLDMPRPFCWDAERAARRIARDVARGRRYSVFPWPLRAAVALGAALPPAVLDWAMAIGLRLTTPR